MNICNSDFVHNSFANWLCCVKVSYKAPLNNECGKVENNTISNEISKTDTKIPRRYSYLNWHLPTRQGDQNFCWVNRVHSAGEETFLPFDDISKQKSGKCITCECRMYTCKQSICDISFYRQMLHWTSRYDHLLSRLASEKNCSVDHCDIRIDWKCSSTVKIPFQFYSKNFFFH